MKGRVAVVVVVGLFFAACGGTATGYQYLAESELGAFLKIPGDWQAYAEEDVISRVVPQGSPDEIATIAADSWTTAFDSSPTPDLAHVFVPTEAYPWGFVQVRPLQAAERDVISLAGLRSQFGPDPLAAQRAGQDVELLAYGEISEPDVWGVRLVVTVGTDDGPATVAQSALVDSARTHLYMIVMGCERACFEEHRDAIQEVIDSWTVVPR